MDVAFSDLLWWLWSRKHQKARMSNVSSINSSADSVMMELDVLRYSFVKGENVPPSSTRVKGEWHSWEERKIDKEYDFVIVPFDGGCVSDAESVGSDWSIGWLEPHGTGFSSIIDDDSRETDNNFAVLVPCYGHNYGTMVEEDPKSNLPSNVGYFSDESKKYVERWISSLQNT